MNLNRFDTVKKLFDTIETASDKVRTIVKNLEDTIGKELSEILGSIASKWKQSGIKLDLGQNKIEILIKLASKLGWMCFQVRW